MTTKSDLKRYIIQKQSEYLSIINTFFLLTVGHNQNHIK